jgi:hypothetical protein
MYAKTVYIFWFALPISCIDVYASTTFRSWNRSAWLIRNDQSLSTLSEGSYHGTSRGRVLLGIVLLHIIHPILQDAAEASRIFADAHRWSKRSAPCCTMLHMFHHVSSCFCVLFLFAAQRGPNRSCHVMSIQLQYHDESQYIWIFIFALLYCFN